MKQIIFILILVLVGLRGAGQDTVYHYFLGTSGTETAVEIFENGEYIDAFGSTGGAGSGLSDVYCVRMNLKFEPIDFVTIGNQGIEKLKAVYKVEETKGYVIFYTAYDGFGDKGYYSKLRTLDSNLIPQAEVSIFGETNHLPIDMVIYADHVYALTEVESSGSYEYKMSVFDSNLDLDREFEINVTDSMVLESIHIDNKIILVGTIKMTDSSHSDVLILNYSLEGDLLHETTFGTSHNEIGKSIISIPDSGYLFTGSTNGYLGLDFDLYLVKLDTSFNVIWEQIHGYFPLEENKDEIGVNSLVGKDGKLYVGMTTETYGQGGKDFLVYILDSLGDFEIGYSFGLEGNETLISIVQFSDSSFTLIGESESNMAFGTNDLYIVHIDQFEGGAPQHYLSQRDTISLMNMVGFFDNRMEQDELVQIVYDVQTQIVKIDGTKEITGSLYSITGEYLFQINLKNSNFWTAANLKTGVYLAKLKSEDGLTQTIRFVVK